MIEKVLFSYLKAISRNIGWVTDSEQEKLRQSRIAVAGLGARIPSSACRKVATRSTALRTNRMPVWPVSRSILSARLVRNGATSELGPASLPNRVAVS